MSEDTLKAAAALVELRAEAAKELAAINQRRSDPHASVLVTLDGSPMCFAVSDDGEALVHFHPTTLPYATLTSRPHADYVCKLFKKSMRAQGVDPVHAGPIEVVALDTAWRDRIRKLDIAIAAYHQPTKATVH